MKRNELKNIRRKRRKAGLRKTLMGGPSRPRLSVFRSNRHIYAQIIDDLAGRTVAAASTNEKGESVDNAGGCDAAKAVGTKLAQRASEAGVNAVVFDRNGFKYHGRVKALAEAVREAGLKF